MLRYPYSFIAKRKIRRKSFGGSIKKKVYQLGLVRACIFFGLTFIMNKDKIRNLDLTFPYKEGHLSLLYSLEIIDLCKKPGV